MPQSDKSELETTIRRHLETCGSADWSRVQAQFSVSPATFWRAVKKVKSESPNLDHGIEEARRRLSDHVAKRSSGAAAAPCAKPSEIVGWKQLDLVRQMEAVFSDIALLRASAVDAEGKPRNLNLFGQCVSMRERAINTAIRCGDAVIGLDTAWGAMDLMVDEVASISPDTARNICTRIGSLAERKMNSGLP